MSAPSAVRSLLPLAIGLAVGVTGAVLFLQSMPGVEGSAEERAAKLEVELKRAQNRIAALEAESASAPAPRGGIIQRLAGDPGGSRDRRKSATDGARRIGEALREGRAVSPEDIFKASQPLMRDLAPLFDRLRVKEQTAKIDSMAGELARKYHLAPQQQALLKRWFEDNANESARRWNDLLAREDTRLEDMMRAARDVRPDEGLEKFMEGVLPPDQLAAFKTERLAERAQRVEREADMKVQRLDSVVGLDEAQRDQVFGIMARGSRDYDPAMAIEGVTGPINSAPGDDRQAAMLAVLRPEQRAAYEAEQQRRRDEAAKDLEALGLALPANWDMFEEGEFRTK